MERIQLIDAVLNLCTYHHPENIQLPAGYWLLQAFKNLVRTLSLQLRITNVS